MKTLVIQTFRTTGVSEWMQRCLASVRAWSAQRGYDHEFMDDAIFALCGEDYLAQVGDNKRSITNLARLELTRLRLDENYDRVIWFDADTFIFAPEKFTITLTDGYAFAKETWLWKDESGRTRTRQSVHNAAFVFAGHHPDLDLLIQTIRHIAATRQIHSNFQVGVKLVTGLHYSLGFPLMTNTGMFSPDTVKAIATNQTATLAVLAHTHGYPIHAANLCWSLSEDTPEATIMAAMDRLEQTHGAVINQGIARTDAAVTLIDTVMPTHNEHAALWQLDSPGWLLQRALAKFAAQCLPTRATDALRALQSRLFQAERR
jgi:hypothetical protein